MELGKACKQELEAECSQEEGVQEVGPGSGTTEPHPVIHFL